MDKWRSGADVGDVFQLDDEFDGRLSSGCWAKGRLRTGDLIMAVSHEGDSFHHYVLLPHGMVKVHPPKGAGSDETETTLSLRAVTTPFGSYRTGRYLFNMADVDRAYLIAGGDQVQVPVPKGYVEPLREEPVSAGLRRAVEICSDELFDAWSSPAEGVDFEIWQAGYDRAARVIRWRCRKDLGENPGNPDDEA